MSVDLRGSFRLKQVLLQCLLCLSRFSAGTYMIQGTIDNIIVGLILYRTVLAYRFFSILMTYIFTYCYACFCCDVECFENYNSSYVTLGMIAYETWLS